MNIKRKSLQGAQRPKRLLTSEKGLALTISLLMLVLLTGLGLAAVLIAKMDAYVSGYYRAQRTGELSADAALELIQAMIFNNAPTLALPITIPAPPASQTFEVVQNFSDSDLDVTVTIRYKQEDSINYNTVETYPDEVVRYGQDYNYANAQRVTGRQPVYAVSVVDNKSGARAEADIITQLGFNTPAAIFVKDTIQIHKWGLATEERIEVTADSGTPALATSLSNDPGNVFVQRVLTKTAVVFPRTSATGAHTNCTMTRRYDDQTPGGPYGYYDYYNPAFHGIMDPGLYQFEPPGDSDLLGRVQESHVRDDVLTDAEIAALIAASDFNGARDGQHVLLGVGNKDADLNVFATLAESQAVFNFDRNDSNVVRYDYPMPGAGTIEEMMGATFTDFRDLADAVLTGTQTVTVPDDFGGLYTTDGAIDMSNQNFGDDNNPQIVFLNSDMDDAGNDNGQDTLVLVTNTGTQMNGSGILVINGNVRVMGSINWRGLMLVRGDLFFRPWQGGNWCNRSDQTLASNWEGFIMVGGDLDLLTLAGGTLLLGYGGAGADEAAIRGIISRTIPHKVLSWRKIYD